MGNILFIIGTVNTGKMMYSISKELQEHSCYFTPFYLNSLDELLTSSMIDIPLRKKHFENTQKFIEDRRLPLDYKGIGREYDLVVTCTDVYIQDNILDRKVVLVQEGITDPESWTYNLIKIFPFLPRYIANTSATGLSDIYEYFCVASEGYRELFTRKGVRPEKIRVTGIPNFDDMEKYRDNDFEHRGYVLAATSPLREVFKPDNRPAFIKKAVDIAGGRQLIFKLHPSEKADRAVYEINTHAPGALIYTDGNGEEMVANCDVLITQLSTLTFVGVALGKEVYTDLDIDEVKRLIPTTPRQAPFPPLWKF